MVEAPLKDRGGAPPVLSSAEHQDHIGPIDPAGLVVVCCPPDGHCAGAHHAEYEYSDENEGDDYRMASDEAHSFNLPRSWRRSCTDVPTHRWKLALQNRLPPDLLHDSVKCLTGLSHNGRNVHAFPFRIAELLR